MKPHDPDCRPGTASKKADLTSEVKALTAGPSLASRVRQQSRIHVWAWYTMVRWGVFLLLLAGFLWLGWPVWSAGFAAIMGSWLVAYVALRSWRDQMASQVGSWLESRQSRSATTHSGIDECAEDEQS